MPPGPAGKEQMGKWKVWCLPPEAAAGEESPVVHTSGSGKWGGMCRGEEGGTLVGGMGWGWGSGVQMVVTVGQR